MPPPAAPAADSGPFTDAAPPGTSRAGPRLNRKGLRRMSNVFAHPEQSQVPVPQPSGSGVDDLRESLFNGRQKGLASSIQIPTELITVLHGIVLDFDPDRLRPAAIPDGATETPDSLYRLAVGPWLARHPVFARAEVRSSGRGVHALLWIDPPVQIDHPGERERWAARVRIIQSILPCDPHAPGITALTRAIGSINSKNGGLVKVLKPGVSLAQDELLQLIDEIRSRPFAVAAQMLLSSSSSPCPVCRRHGSRLGVQDRIGLCYGGCGRVTLGRLLAAYVQPSTTEQDH